MCDLIDLSPESDKLCVQSYNPFKNNNSSPKRSFEVTVERSPERRKKFEIKKYLTEQRKKNRFSVEVSINA